MSIKNVGVTQQRCAAVVSQKKKEMELNFPLLLVVVYTNKEA